YVGSDGLLRAQLFWKGAADPVVSAGVVNDGQFHHVAVSYDGVSQTVYLDGKPIGSKAHTQVAYAGSYQYQLGTGLTGAWPGGNGGLYAFQGLIDEPAFYSRARSAAEGRGAAGAAGLGKFPPVAGANVAPTITAVTVPASSSEGSPVTLSATATDPAGANDPLSYTWTITRPDG